MQLDVVLVAEGARASGAALSTPRYEPSWFFDEIDDALVDACMRPRRREQDDLSAFISSVNMRMRLGQATLASRLYERLLQRTLTDAHREVVERKLKEATGAKTSRSHAPRTAGIPQDELAQLLDPARAAQEVEGEERERLLKLLRRRGHACNEADEYENAHYWFDCAYALEHQISDLLSAANMRLKLVDISPVAEALYLHVLTELHVSEREKAMAERKLSQLKENTRNLSASQEYTLVAEL